MRAAKAHVLAGYAVVVDLDIASSFDRVNHDVLMGRLAQRIGDERILGLIGHGGAMQVAFPRSYWADQGLVSLVDRWSRVRVV